MKSAQPINRSVPITAWIKMKPSILLLAFVVQIPVEGSSACMNWLAILGNLPHSTVVNLETSDFDAYRHVSSDRYLAVLNKALPGQDRQSPRSQGLETISVLRTEIDFKRPITELGTISVELSPGTQTNELSFSIGNDAEKPNAKGHVKLAAPMNIPSSDVPTPYGLPIRYERNVDIENTPDFDTGSEVLRTVILSRWYVVKERFGLENQDFLKRGTAFFMKRAEIDLLLPLESVKEVTVTSWASSLSSDRTELTVPFEVRGADGVCYSRGILHFAVVAVSSGKPQRSSLPVWVEELFWDKP